MLVRIERYYDYPDLKRQTPDQSMKWEGITFTEEAVKTCDFLVILEYPGRDIEVEVPPGHIIHICQEPPNEVSLYRQYGNKKNGLIINQYDIGGSKLSHGALPWHVDKTYDELKAMPSYGHKKNDEIAWITGYQKSSRGHRDRSAFIDRIRDFSFMNLYGRGIRPIEDKWEALYPVKYGIAYENTRSSHYWTEKISDCLLSFTMPIYFGCDNISDFFPKDSYISLDPEDPHIDLYFKEILEKDLFSKNYEALLEARSLILDKLQLFPFITEIIRTIQNDPKIQDQPQKFLLKGNQAYFDNYPASLKFNRVVRKILRKLKHV